MEEYWIDEKFGKVPVGWEVKKFGSCVKVCYGKDQKNVVDKNGRIPVYGTGGIIEYAKIALCNHESILIGRKGTIDKPYYIKNPFWCVDTTYYVEKFTNGNMKFLYYLLCSKNLKTLNEATGVPSVTRRTLNRQKLLLPPLAEQSAIARILSTLDEAIRSTSETVKKLERVKQSLMQNLLSGKMKPDGTLRTADEFYEDEKMGLVPRGWTVKAIGDVTNILDSKRKPIKSADRKNIKGQFPYYGAAGIVDYINDYLFDGKYILFGEDGENLISRKVPQAFIVTGKFWVNNHAHILEINEQYDIRLICEMLENRKYDNIVYGSAQPKIKKSDLCKIRLLLPDKLSEQNEMSNAIDCLKQQIQNKQEKITALELLKKSLMQQLLTGKVRVKC